MGHRRGRVACPRLRGLVFTPRGLKTCPPKAVGLVPGARHPPGPPIDEADGPFQVILTDLNQEGLKDVVTTNKMSDDISVLINFGVLPTGG